MRNRGTPGRTMLEHGVQDNQQLTHTGCESQLLGLTRRQQALVEDPDDWVVAAGRQRPHVQSAANSGASTPDGAFAPRSTAVSVEGSHTNQGSDLPTVQRAQLRQVCQESQRELFSHAGNSAQEILFLSPHRTLVQSLPQFLIQVVQLLLQPGYVSLDARTEGSGGSAQAVFLRHQHGHHLVSAGDQRIEGLGLGVPQGAHGRTNDLGEVSQDLSIQSVGLGQRPGGPGKVSHLAGIDHHNRQRRRCQGSHQGQFQATRGFQQHHGGTQVPHLGDQLPDACIVIGDLPSVALPEVEGELCDLRMTSLGWTPGAVSGVIESECEARVEEPVELQTVAGHADVTETVLMDARVTAIAGTVAAATGASHVSVPFVPDGETRFRLGVPTGEAIHAVTVDVSLEASLRIPMPPLTQLTHHPARVQHVTKTVHLHRPGDSDSDSETATATCDDGSTSSATATVYAFVPSATIAKRVTVEVLHPEHVKAETVERSPISGSRDESLTLESGVGSDAPFEALVLPEPEPEEPPAEQEPADGLRRWFEQLGWEWPW